MQISEKEEFFMVYLEGERCPAFKHETIDKAITEGARLSNANRKKAYILKTVTVIDIQSTIPKVTDDLPF